MIRDYLRSSEVALGRLGLHEPIMGSCHGNRRDAENRYFLCFDGSY